MAGFNRFFAYAYLAVVYANSSAQAAPPLPSTKFATHRTTQLSSGLTIEAFHPPSTFEVFGVGIDHPLSKRADSSIEEAALAFVESHLGVDTSAITFKSGYAGEVAKHAYVKQTHDGIPFANAVANVAFNNNNKVVAFGSSFVTTKSIASSTPTIPLSQAIATAEKALSGTFNQHPATLEFFTKDDGTTVLTHVVQIRNEESGTWFEGFVDAHSGEMVSITDFVSKATYRVIPLENEILTQGFATLTDPQDLTASPLGWQSTTGTIITTTTSGNNAIAFKGTIASFCLPDIPGFVFEYDPTDEPTTPNNMGAACVNAYYCVNELHDCFYRYGFTEVAFNFQVNNFGKGGIGNDPVTISIQSSAGTNNADFATPPDGQSGAMRQFLWTLTSPERDGALENDIVVHENTHGITNRMTGGGTGRCLQTTEAGGMGEGWSDAMADWTEKNSSAVPDYVLGPWVINDPAGIRTHPYSTSAAVNPLRYSSLRTMTAVLDIGEVWANILHNVYAALVGVHGWSASARTNPAGTEGNVVFLHLFIDALALQPCNPTFLTARTAWIQADVNRYAGANKCTLWKAFASRGLGVNAANHVDSTVVPAGC